MIKRPKLLVVGFVLFVSLPFVYRLSIIMWTWAGGDASTMAGLNTVVIGIASLLATLTSITELE